METKELYKLVKDATRDAGRTIAMKLEEELIELEDELGIARRISVNGSTLHNSIELADEIADVTIMVDQYTEKDFWKLVCDRRLYKLGRLEKRVGEGCLF